MIIKVCGIKHKSNAFEIAETGPDYIGFIFYASSPRYFYTGDLGLNILCLPKEIKRAGVFVNSDINYIKEKIDKYQLSCVQLHGNESPEFCSLMKSLGCEVIKAFGVDEEFDFKQLIPYEQYVDMFLFDTRVDNVSGGTGVKFNWNVFENYTLGKPFMLSGGIGPDDVKEIKELRYEWLYGIDINSRFELEPGLKNARAVSEFISAIKAE